VEAVVFYINYFTGQTGQLIKPRWQIATKYLYYDAGYNQKKVKLLKHIPEEN